MAEGSKTNTGNAADDDQKTESDRCADHAAKRADQAGAKMPGERLIPSMRPADGKHERDTS